MANVAFMQLHPTKIYATPEILTGGQEIAQASYTKLNGRDITITFTHAGRTGSFWPTTWEQMLSLCPPIAGIRFNEDADSLVYDEFDQEWKSTTFRHG